MIIDPGKVSRELFPSFPVVYLHEGSQEELVAALVDPTWLSEVWQAALRGGFENAHAADNTFLPHTHLTEEDA